MNKPHPARFAQSLAPATSAAGSASATDGTGSQSFDFLDKDSYMSRVPGTGMTNQRALQVLAQIESKLAGERCRNRTSSGLIARLTIVPQATKAQITLCPSQSRCRS